MLPSISEDFADMAALADDELTAMEGQERQQVILVP